MPDNKQPENDPKLEAEVDEMMNLDRPKDVATAPELVDSDESQLHASEDGSLGQTSSGRPENDTSLDNDQTAQAIDDINKQDSDTVLAAEDNKVATKADGVRKPSMLKRWWRNKPWRYGLIVFILACLAAAYLAPTSRYWVLNHIGVRGQVTLTVLDNTTKLPLSDASVTMDNQVQTSDKAGKVTFAKVRLGRQVMTVSKLAFAEKTERVTINPGNNNIGKLALIAVGVQYKFTLTDYLSGQPVVGATVSNAKSSALSDTKGLAVLTLVGEQKAELNIKISAKGYHDKTVAVPSDERAKITTVSLVPNGKDYFVSKASGDYSVYSSYLDGSNRKLVLAGSGNENGDISLITNGDASLLALVSVRDKHRDAEGNPQQALTIINTMTNQPLTIDHASNIHLIGWLDGDTIAYVAIQACSGSNSCYQLKSYDYDSGAGKELATGPSFSSYQAIDDTIYYAVNDFSDPSKSVFASINSDGTNSRTILSQDVFGVYRSSYNQLDLAATGQWYSYQIGGKTAQKINAPSNPTSDQYVDSPNGQKSAWIDRRDGQDVLLIYDKSSGQSKVVASLDGLSLPIRWLDNNTLVLRSSTSNQTADYVFSLLGGKPQKIVDVTNAAGAFSY